MLKRPILIYFTYHNPHHEVTRHKCYCLWGLLWCMLCHLLVQKHRLGHPLPLFMVSLWLQYTKTMSIALLYILFPCHVLQSGVFHGVPLNIIGHLSWYGVNYPVLWFLISKSCDYRNSLYKICGPKLWALPLHDQFWPLAKIENLCHPFTNCNSWRLPFIKFQNHSWDAKVMGGLFLFMQLDRPYQVCWLLNL